MSSSNARGSEPLVGKFPLMVCPDDRFVANSDGSRFVSSSGDGIFKAGSGECLPELPEGGSPVATTDNRDDVQAERFSPVGKKFGNQVETHV
jgi:hypothetical protein